MKNPFGGLHWEGFEGFNYHVQSHFGSYVSGGDPDSLKVLSEWDSRVSNFELCLFSRYLPMYPRYLGAVLVHWHLPEQRHS